MKPNPFQSLPHTIDVDGVLYPIDSDFRLGITIENEMLEENPDVDGLLTAFYKGKIPPNVKAAAEKMLWFYMCRGDEQEDGKKEGESKKSAKIAYDFVQDADALLADFLKNYNVDLNEDDMHWWTFRKLMINLPQESELKTRIWYRTADTSKMGKQQRNHVKKMRRIHAIKRKYPESKMTAEEREQALKDRVRKRFEEAQKQAKMR